MKQYTVTKLREKLASIVPKIFTSEYAAIYESMSDMSQEDAAEIVTSTIDETNSLIVVFANCLNDPYQISSIINQTQPLLLFSLYMRYYYLTQYLMSTDQNKLFSLRENDKDFLLDVLIGIFYNFDQYQ